MGFFDKKKPVDIVSDTMEGFDKEKYVVFKGSVIAKQEDLYIFADTIEAYMSEETNEIEKAIARGNVKIVKQDRTATCREAIFENAKGEITLKENVIVYQGKDKLTGDVIIYYVNEDRVTVQAEKDKKAHVTIQPKEEKK
jgi:lipopolysaccharide export system protein LptA